MSTTDPSQARPTVRQYQGGDSPTYTYTDEDTGYGWVVFAGTMLAILATVNFIEGVAAVSNSTFFVANAKFVISGLHTWGWVLIGLSVVQIATAFGVWAQVSGVRWVGVAVASINAIIQLIAMPAYPFWSLTMFALDILIIYGLIAHGARAKL
jgi:hypothetical protein